MRIFLYLNDIILIKQSFVKIKNNLNNKFQKNLLIYIKTLRMSLIIPMTRRKKIKHKSLLV